MERAFTNLKDLRMEIDLLKIKKFEQEEVLKDKLTDPSAIFRTIYSHFKSKPSSNKSFLLDLFNQDIITNIARIIFPLALNKTLFKKSGFIVKTLITFLSQKVAKEFDNEAINRIIDKIKGWFVHTKQQRKKQRVPVDYGIPPDSETF